MIEEVSFFDSLSKYTSIYGSGSFPLDEQISGKEFSPKPLIEKLPLSNLKHGISGSDLRNCEQPAS